MKVLFSVVMCGVVSVTALGQQTSSPPSPSSAPQSSAAPAQTPVHSGASTQAGSPSAVSEPQEKPPEHPCTEAQVREYLEETGGAKAAHVIMMNMARTSRASAPPYFPAAFWTDMVAAFDKADMVPMFLPVYQHHISEEEMAAVLNFYKTPAGKHFLDAQPVMAGEAQQLIAQQGREIGHDVYLKYKDQIEEGKRQYDAQQGGSGGSGAPGTSQRPGRGSQSGMPGSRAPGTVAPRPATSPAPNTTTPAPTNVPTPTTPNPTPDPASTPK